MLEYYIEFYLKMVSLIRLISTILYEVINWLGWESFVLFI
jgi:hypothetical protein